MNCCERANQDEINSIAALAEEMSEKSDRIEPLEFFKIDMEFHRQLVAASRTSSIETHRQYNARLWRARFVSSRRATRRPMTLNQHDHIATSLKERDTQKIAIELRTHLDTTIKNIAEDQEDTLLKSDLEQLMKPRIALIPGDPSGIGPELVAKLLAEPGLSMKMSW